MRHGQAVLLARNQLGLQQPRALMRLVKLKGIERGREHHLRTVGEHHGLQDIDRLRDVGHLDAVGVLIEDIERHSRDHRIAHGVLLVEEAGVGAWLDVEPGAPLVHDQADAFFRVVTVHDRAVTAHQVVHKQRALERIGVIHLGKLCRAAFIALPVTTNRIIVHRKAVHIGRGVGHQHFGPAPVGIFHAGSGAAGDLVDLIGTVLLDVGLIAAKQVGIVFRAHISAAAPVFVAHAEIIDLPGLGMAVARALLRHGGISARSHVFNPFGHLLHGAGADVAVDIGLAANLAAKFHELVRAEAIVLHHASPVGVDHALAVFLRADALLPVIFVGKASARPAQHRQTNAFERLHNVRAHAVDIWDGAVLAHKETVVDAAAEMLGEIAIDLRLDDCARLVREDELLYHEIRSFYFIIS